MKVATIRAVVTAALAASGTAASAGPGLLDAWLAAQTHDPDYASALAGQRAGQTKERQARALLRPQVVLSASGSYVSDERTMTGAQFSAPGFGTSNDATFRTRVAGGIGTDWSVALRQPLYNAEKSAAARQLATQRELADAQLAANTQQAMLATVRAYVAVVAADDTLASIRAQKASTQEARDVSRALYDEGKLPITDSIEAEARYDEIVAAEIAARDELEQRRAEFADRTGLSADGLRAFNPDVSIAALDAGPLEVWLERARSNAPQLRVRKLDRDVARAEADKTRHGWSPTVDLVAKAAGDRLQGDSGWGSGSLTSRSLFVGVQLNVPLFTSGMLSARQDESVALAEQAEEGVRGAELESTRRARAAWLALHGDLAQVEARQKALLSARARVDATELGREVGARTTLDLLDARAQRDREQLTLAQTRLAAIVARLELAAAAGALTDDDLRQADAMLTRP
ncbi:MAG TPA: TolC family protein [Burkholderiaceae bacterium]|nr:TolC family protein [Burkholderiaceae bacterium]